MTETERERERVLNFSTYICLWHTTQTQSVVRVVNSRHALHTRNLHTRQGAPRLVMRPNSVLQREQWRFDSCNSGCGWMLWLFCCCWCCWISCWFCGPSSDPLILRAPFLRNVYNSARSNLWKLDEDNKQAGEIVRCDTLCGVRVVKSGVYLSYICVCVCKSEWKKQIEKWKEKR